MDIRNRRELKATAEDALRLSGDTGKKLALIYTGLTALLSLALTAVSYLLDLQMAGAGGLGGLGTRSVLTFIRSVLELGSNLALPFWQMGFLFAAMGLARKEAVQPTSLLEGFRKFGPVLRLTIYKSLLITASVLLCVYASILVFSFLPTAQLMMDTVEVAYQRALAEGLEEVIFTDGEWQQLMIQCVPMLLIFGALSLVLVLPTVYRYRMAEYALLDAPEKGARMAVFTSRKLMFCNRMALLKLDLSFWWYYVALILIGIVGNGDQLLQLLGFSVPVSPTVSAFGFLILHLVLQVAFSTWALPRVEVTYANAYFALLQAPPQEAKPPFPETYQA